MDINELAAWSILQSVDHPGKWEFGRNMILEPGRKRDMFLRRENYGEQGNK